MPPVPPPPSRPLLRAAALVAALLLLTAPAPPARADGAAPWADWWPPDPTPAPARDGSWPLRPRPVVVEGFDPPDLRWGAGHRGVDLAGRAGAPVRSALPGTVAFAAPLAGRGVVVVDHGGVRTTYQPVTASVRVGDRVAEGQVVGTLGLAGSHCFPQACLHWGLRRGEAYLDPLVLVGGGPVRLLPLAR
ncbi:M23 family metallopeptidase [Nocardioides scoriae]|uniref:M23 family metallopeptidase n=1 Tax=Nocardioides scoriae TaxID=642780 RepID=UPI001E494608|nr:M23 family metallopeptidase [Nocardioides scoriae]